MSKTTPNRITYELCGYDLSSRAEKNQKTQEAKWKERISKLIQPSNGGIDDLEEPLSELRESDEERVNTCKGIPSNGVKLINFLTKICPCCQGSCTMDLNHLREVHNLDIPDPLYLFKKIQEESDQVKGTGTLRMYCAWRRIQEYVDRINFFLSKRK